MLLSFLFLSASTHAATMNVVAGSDDIAVNGQCQLSEAIININDQAQTYADCPAGDSASDTINLPSGTIILTDNLPVITEPIIIQGQGMGASIIDGDSQWRVLEASLTAGNFNLTGITVTGFEDMGILIRNAEEAIVHQVEIDGEGAISSSGQLVGLGVNNDSSYENRVSITDVYIHDIDVDASNIMQVFAIASSGQSESIVTASNISIARITNTGSAQIALFGPLLGTVNGDAPFTADVSNITVTDITSTAGITMAIGIVNFDSINIVPVLNLTNATVDNITTPNGMPLNIPAVIVASAAQNVGDIARAQLNATNIIVSRSSGSSINCGIFDIGLVVGGAGTGTGTFSSQGGNLSDDNSCSSYFTQASDQNNVSGLAQTLAPLADNGGYVPTMALLQNSPAIDAGVPVAGLTTDARGAVRPQGDAFDSGAYESPFTRQDSDDQDTLAETGESRTIPILVALFLVSGGVTALYRQRKAGSVQ